MYFENRNTTAPSPVFSSSLLIPFSEVEIYCYFQLNLAIFELFEKRRHPLHLRGALPNAAAAATAFYFKISTHQSRPDAFSSLRLYFRNVRGKARDYDVSVPSLIAKQSECDLLLLHTQKFIWNRNACEWANFIYIYSCVSIFTSCSNEKFIFGAAYKGGIPNLWQKT